MINMLVVDDEYHIREGIKNGINWEEVGVNICGIAGSGYEALDMIEKYTPNIVITDIRMSDMDGLELLDVINKKYSNIKVILISGYKDFHYAQTAVSLNAFCYILKPIDHNELLTKVLEAKRLIEEQLEKVKRDEDIQKRLEENISILRDNFFTQLVSGKKINPAEIEKKSKFLNINLSGPQYVICVLEPEVRPDYASELDVYDESLYKAAVMSISEAVMGNGCKSYTFNLDDRIGLLICGENISRNILKKKCETIIGRVNSTIGISVTIGIGNIYKNKDKISVSYKEALDAIEYKMILGKNLVIPVESVYANLKEKAAKNKFLDTLKNCEDDLILAIKSDNRESMVIILKEITEALHESIKSNIQEKDHLIFLVSFFIMKIMFVLDININMLFDNEGGLINTLQNLQTINELEDYIIKCFDEAAEELREKNKSHNGFLVKLAIEYISKNIYNDITLMKVADYLMIHPNYLSKIFKQETGEPFVEYVIKVKMSEAKLLLRNSNNKVYEIANMLSYKDVGHFARTFKKFFGVSPTEYRQLL
ncbi:MAG: response regulator [Firmicutes bacterium]|nr:response regulator [Bacillota bacterium]